MPDGMNLFNDRESENEMEAVVRAAQAGDRDSFLKAFESVQQALYRAACVIMENQQDAYDATQETALIAYRCLPHLRQPCYFKTWITRIMINKCRAMLRERKKVVLQADMNTWSVSLQERSADDLGVLEAVNSLSFPYRTVVVLRYLEGYNQKEIARILNLPLGTVKSRINGALKKLREQLRLQGVFEYRAGGEFLGL
jgi:RNA polymerase sigma-70 factor (ECF subfamily)